MIGILIVTHGNFGTELLKSAELIIGKQDNVKTLGLNHGDNVDELYDRVSEAIKELDNGDGVLVFTDLFGGSPSNVVARNMEHLNFYSLTGVNLPMLIEALDSRYDIELEELVDTVCTSGIEGIKNIRSELLVNSNA